MNLSWCLDNLARNLCEGLVNSITLNERDLLITIRVTIREQTVNLRAALIKNRPLQDE